MTSIQELNERIDGQNLAIRFLSNLERNGDVDVLRWKSPTGDWSSWTLQELADVTARLITGLRGLGVGKGDSVVLMMRNRPEFHALDIAALFLGATPVSIYNSSAAEQIEYLVNDCAAKVAVIEDEGFLERFLKVREALPTLEQIVMIEPSEIAGTSASDYADLVASCTGGPPSGVGDGDPRRPGDDHLHLRHHRTAEGRDAQPRQRRVDAGVRARSRCASRRRSTASPANGTSRTCRWPTSSSD